MDLKKVFLGLCILAVFMLGALLIVNILVPEEKVVVINQLGMAPEMSSTKVIYPHELSSGKSLEKAALESNQKYYPIEQRQQEDLRVLRKETKNWNGRVDMIEYNGRDEQVFGSEQSHLYLKYDY